MEDSVKYHRSTHLWEPALCLARSWSWGQKTASFSSGTFTPVILVPEGKGNRLRGVKWCGELWPSGGGAKDKQQGGECMLFGGEPVLTSSFRNYIPVFFGKLTFTSPPSMALPQLQWLADQCLCLISLDAVVASEMGTWPNERHLLGVSEDEGRCHFLLDLQGLE